MRLFLDANVLFSAAHQETGNAQARVALGRAGRCALPALHVLRLSYILLTPEVAAMTLSVRLNPDLARLLDKAARQRRKSRSALVHDALAQYLRPARPRLGDAIREVLADSPQGLGIERRQPKTSERRAKVR